MRFFLAAAAVLIAITTAGLARECITLSTAWCTPSSGKLMMTDNGLSTADYAHWPAHTIFLLLSASFFGGCVGSTCGGIKALPFSDDVQAEYPEMNQLAHPRALLTIKVGNSVVNERVLRSVWSFFFLYVMITGFSSGRSI